MNHTDLLTPKTAPNAAIANDVCRIIRDVPDANNSPDIVYCREMVDDCISNKSNLIGLLSKHPNWDADNYRIHFDADYVRAANPSAAQDNIEYMINEITRFTGKVMNGITRSLVERTWYNSPIYRPFLDRWVKRHPLLPERILLAPLPAGANHLTPDEINFIFQSSYYGILSDDNILVKTHGKFGYLARLCRVIYGMATEFTDLSGVSESLVDSIKMVLPDAHITAGTKCTRAVLKLLRQYGFDDLPEDVKHTALQYYSKYADAMSPLTVKRHTVLSVNPADFLLMSNGNSWDSCHFVWHDNGDTGCYRAGCESYAYDTQTMLFYTVESENPDADLTFAPRVTRQCYFWNGSVLIGSRAYPQGTDINSPDVVRNRQLVEGIISECLGVPNLWRKALEPIRFISQGHHYRDYVHFPYSAHELSYTEDERDYEFLIGSDQAICVCCGEYLSDSHYPVCPSCAGSTSCASCGDYYDEDEMYYVEGYGYVCEDCLDDVSFHCDACGGYYDSDTYDYHEVYHNTRWGSSYNRLCEDCFNRELDCGDIVLCEDDEEYWEIEDTQEYEDPDTGEIKYYSPEFDLSELEEEEAA